MQKALFVLFLLLSSSLLAQNPSDSLWLVWQSEAHSDTDRYLALNKLIWKDYLFAQPDSAFILAQHLVDLGKQKQEPTWEAKALRTQGISYNVRGELAQALHYYNLSLVMQKEAGDSNGIAAALVSIGTVHSDLENPELCIKYTEESLAIFEALENKRGIQTCKGNLAVAYMAIGELEQAIQYNEQSLDLVKENNSLLSLGGAVTLNNLGTCYEKLDSLDRAKEYFEQALDLMIQLDNKDGTAGGHYNLGSLYFRQGNVAKALELTLESMRLAEEIHSINWISSAAQLLSQIYESQGKDAPALEMYKLYTSTRDSMQSEDLKKQIAQSESRAEFEKEQLIQAQELKEQQRLVSEKIARRNSIQYGGIGVGVLSLFGLVFFIGKIRLPQWLMDLTVLLPFLVFFEFLLVITDPFIDSWSGGEPMVKLMCNVALAGLVIPLHTVLERFFRKKVLAPKT